MEDMFIKFEQDGIEIAFYPRFHLQIWLNSNFKALSVSKLW